MDAGGGGVHVIHHVRIDLSLGSLTINKENDAVTLSNKNIDCIGGIRSCPNAAECYIDSNIHMECGI